MVENLCTHHNCKSGSCGFMWQAPLLPNCPTPCVSRVQVDGNNNSPESSFVSG
jgi:hypothetical protein